MANTTPAKKRRIFPWIFLAVQALFLVWIITGISSAGSQECPPSLTAEACEAATGVGAGIGVALIIALWVAVDVILGLTYLMFRFSRRRG